MTKTVVQGVVIVLCMTGFWISLSTKLDTNSNASAEVSSKLKDQVELYREEAGKAQVELLNHVDTTQGYVNQAIEQNSSLAEQNQKLLASIDGLTKQMLALTEQNADLLKQIKSVNDGQIKILSEHTQALQEAKVEARRSSAAAESAQINTRRALKAITKPTPKPWYSGFFVHPTPTPKKR